MANRLSSTQAGHRNRSTQDDSFRQHDDPSPKRQKNDPIDKPSRSNVKDEADIDGETRLTQLCHRYRDITEREVSGKRYFEELYFTESMDPYTQEGYYRLQWSWSISYIIKGATLIFRGRFGYLAYLNKRPRVIYFNTERIFVASNPMRHTSPFTRVGYLPRMGRTTGGMQIFALKQLVAPRNPVKVNTI